MGRGPQQFLRWIFDLFFKKTVPAAEPQKLHTATLTGELGRISTPATKHVVGETVHRQLQLVIQERDNKIKELEKEIRQMKVDGNQKDRKLEELNDSIERCTGKQAEIDRIRQREKYYRLKCDTLERKLKGQDQ